MGGSGSGIPDGQGYRVALLLVVFIVIIFCLDWCFKWVERAVRDRKGILEAVRSLKNELLLLGAISLLLAAFQVRYFFITHRSSAMPDASVPCLMQV